ncbi:MAG: hypothetical protein HN572_11475 [Kordiimonadaceae bacterium]|nr:hypothetical protein [Kordiimonadaceae bacterium]
MMPILLELTYTDGSKENYNIPAEIWRRSYNSVKKLLVLDKELAQVVIDPRWETADVDIENNHYPRRIIPSRIETFKNPPRRRGLKERDIMHDIKTELKNKEDNN